MKPIQLGLNIFNLKLTLLEPILFGYKYGQSVCIGSCSVKQDPIHTLYSILWLQSLAPLFWKTSKNWMTTFNFTFLLSLWRWLRFSFPLSSSNTFSITAVTFTYTASRCANYFSLLSSNTSSNTFSTTKAFKAFYSPICQWPAI